MRRVWLQFVVFGLVVVAMGVVVVGFLRERGRDVLPVIGVVGDFSLVNQFGEVFGSEDLRGGPWVANIFFSRCPGICREMTGRMRLLQDGLGEGDGLRLVSITTDPVFDRPGVLLEYGERFGADGGRWFFLTGGVGEVGRVIREELLLVSQENVEGERVSELDLFTHSSLFVLVDGGLRVRGLYESLGSNVVEEVLGDLGRL